MHLTAALIIAIGLSEGKALASHLPAEPRAPTQLALNARLTEQKANNPLKAPRPTLLARLPLLREMPIKRDAQLMHFELIKQFQVKHVIEA
jgi:hypothetical protein